MVITQTPLRISFLGGGTDFPGYYLKNGGCVLTTAINKYVYCIIKKRFDDLIYINYSEKEVVNKVEEIKHELVREAMKLTRVEKGVEISFLSDIPASGSGLGSSSSVTVGTLNALYTYKGASANASKLANEACEIELERLKKPIGVQDQAIAAYGGIRFMEFMKDGKIKVQSIELSEELMNDLSSYMMMFFTGTTRKAESILKEQMQNIAQKTELLKRMSEYAYEGRELLVKGNILELGRLLNKGWLTKRELASGVSNSNIDNMYNAAINAGAIGGKISGAGGGGFLTLFVPTNKRQQVRQALINYREVPVSPSLIGSRVIFNIENN